MNKLTRLAKSAQFHAFIALLVAALINWPLLSIADSGGAGLVIYLLTIWVFSILTFAAFDFLSRKDRPSASDAERKED